MESETKANKKQPSAQMEIYRFVLSMIFKIGCGTVALLILFIGSGFGLDKLLNTSPYMTIVFIVISAPVAMFLIFIFIRKNTTHLSKKNIMDNPEVFLKDKNQDKKS